MFKIELNNRIYSVTAAELKNIQAKGLKPSFVL